MTDWNREYYTTSSTPGYEYKSMDAIMIDETLTSSSGSIHSPLRIEQDEEHPFPSSMKNDPTITSLFSSHNYDGFYDYNSQLHRELEPSPVIKTLAEIFSKVLLFLLIFGMSATVDSRNLKRQLRNKYAICTGVAMQFLIMPLLGFIAVISLKKEGLTPAMGITLLMVTSSPGGSYSNWWCSLFNADLALSVAMTALSTILSIGLLPANLMLYSYLAYGRDDGNGGNEQNILKSVDFAELFISIGIVIAAIVAGLYTSLLVDSDSFRKTCNAMGSVSGVALIVFSFVFSTFGRGSDNDDDEEGGTVPGPWAQHWSFYIGTAMPCLAGLALANIIARFARLEKAEVVTLSVECCYQNVGIATSAALAMFDNHRQTVEALAVPLFYGILEAVILGIYCLVAWKLDWTKAPKDENLCIVLSKTYEVEEGEDLDDRIETTGHHGRSGDIEENCVTSCFDSNSARKLTERADVTASTGGSVDAGLINHDMIDHTMPSPVNMTYSPQRSRIVSTDLTITTAHSRERTSTEELEENLQRGIERSASHHTSESSSSRMSRIRQSRFMRRLFFNRSMHSSADSDNNNNNNVQNHHSLPPGAVPSTTSSMTTARRQNLRDRPQAQRAPLPTIPSARRSSRSSTAVENSTPGTRRPSRSSPVVETSRRSSRNSVTVENDMSTFENSRVPSQNSLTVENNTPVFERSRGPSPTSMLVDTTPSFENNTPVFGRSRVPSQNSLTAENSMSAFENSRVPSQTSLVVESTSSFENTRRPSQNSSGVENSRSRRPSEHSTTPENTSFEIIHVDQQHDDKES